MEHLISNFNKFVNILNTESNDRQLEEARNLRIAFEDLRDKWREK